VLSALLISTKNLLNSSGGMKSSFFKSKAHDVHGSHTKKVSPLVPLPSQNKKRDDIAECNVNQFASRQDLVNETNSVERADPPKNTSDLETTISNSSCEGHTARHERRQRRRQISLVECQQTSTRLWQEERNAEYSERNSFFGLGGWIQFLYKF